MAMSTRPYGNRELLGTEEQRQHYQDLVRRMNAFHSLPYNQFRIHNALDIFRSATLSPETMRDQEEYALGYMDWQYAKCLFSVAEQALRGLADALSRRTGEDRARFSTYRWPPPTNSMLHPQAPNTHHDGLKNKKNPTNAELAQIEKGMRIMVLRDLLTTLFDLPDDSSERIAVAAQVFALHAGAAAVVVLQGVRVPLPKLNAPDAEWLTVVFASGAFAIFGLARCLSVRFMQRPVKIWGEVVAGTGQSRAEANLQVRQLLRSV